MSTQYDCGSCTQCCKAIHLHKSVLNFRGNPKAVGDVNFVLSNWKPISIRRAKKLNPHIFDKSFHGAKRVVKIKRDMIFFKCKNLTDTGCLAYENRPTVCSGYPFYDRPPHKPPTDYAKDCVYIQALN